MRRARPIRWKGIFAVVLSALAESCGAAATPPPSIQLPEAPPPASGTSPAAAEASHKPAQTGEAPVGRPTGLPGTSIRFAGGNGTSKEQAIVILGAKGESDGVASEYKYLELVYGPKGSSWKPLGQGLIQDGGRQFDALEIEVEGAKRTIYFDITDYFGKF